MSSFWLRLAVFLASWNVTYCVRAPQCEFYAPKPTQHEGWGINKKLPDSKFGFTSRSTRLYCCAVNYDSLVWSFNGQTFPWFEVTLMNGVFRYELLYGNQSLGINPVTPDNEGEYTCTVRKGPMEEHHTLSLSIAASANYAGPAHMEKQPYNQTGHLGSNVTFPCEGWFGGTKNVLDSARWDTEWSIRSANETKWTTEFPNRYHVTKSYRKNRLYIMENLTIIGIQQEDYDVKFRCIVDNVMGNLTIKIVHLLRPEWVHVVKIKQNHGNYREILGAIAGVLLVVILVTLLLWCYRLEVQIFLRDKFRKSEFIGHVSHGAFVVYSEESEEDSSFVLETLLEEVENRMGYSILISDRDFIPGSARAEEYVRCMDQSARFVVVLSPDFLNDKWCDFALNVALEKEKRIVFVVLKKIENWNEFKNEKLMKSIVSIKQKVKWPKNHTSRKVDKFYKQLQLQLPPLLS